MGRMPAEHLTDAFGSSHQRRGIAGPARAEADGKVGAQARFTAAITLSTEKPLQMGGVLRRLAAPALRGSARHIEIAEGHVANCMGMAHVAQHDLGHQLGAATGRDGLEPRGLGDPGSPPTCRRPPRSRRR
jgi:hypothetical protein